MDLQRASGVTQKTITDFESGTTAPQEKTLRRIRAALEKAGVIFIDSNGEGAGVRLKKRKC